jgi:hypothetical protein
MRAARSQADHAEGSFAPTATNAALILRLCICGERESDPLSAANRLSCALWACTAHRSLANVDWPDEGKGARQS